MKSPSNKIVSIIIVTYGVKDYLASCLGSLRKQTYFGFEVILIDNSLNHSFREEISKDYAEIKLCVSSENLFYCSALNLGIHTSKGEFILCLNDDVVLDERFIEEALKVFDIDDRIGLVSGKILRSDGKTIDSTGLFLSLWRTAKERGYGFKDRGQYEKEEYVFAVNGAVAFYRKQMLEDIKIDSDYFDTDYHIFYEDLDIAWQAQNLGWRAYYTPRAIAYHVRGGTVRPECGIDRPYARRYLNNELQFDLLKNRYLTIIKNESFFGFVSCLTFILIYDFLVWAYILIFRPYLIRKFILNLKIFKSAFKKRILIRKIRELKSSI